MSATAGFDIAKEFQWPVVVDDRKRAEGTRHHQALIAPARRRVNVLYAILRDRRPYQARPPLHLVA